MKKRNIIILLILILIVAMVLFNPTKEDFNKKIHEISSDGSITYEEAKLFGADKIYESGYERQNYYLFSIYTTNGSTNKLWTKDGYAGKDITYIGIFRIFIQLN
jgi:ABC-type lipoprotein release transport system permease subunit